LCWHFFYIRQYVSSCGLIQGGDGAGSDGEEPVQGEVHGASGGCQVSRKSGESDTLSTVPTTVSLSSLAKSSNPYKEGFMEHKEAIKGDDHDGVELFQVSVKVKAERS
jgi:hypothetical protein